MCSVQADTWLQTQAPSCSERFQPLHALPLPPRSQRTEQQSLSSQLPSAETLARRLLKEHWPVPAWQQVL